MSPENTVRQGGEAGGGRGLASRLAGLTVTSAVVLTVLAMWTGFADTFGFPKLLVLSFCSFVALVFVAADPAMRGRASASRLLWPLLALAAWGLLSTVVSSLPGRPDFAGEDGSWNGALTLTACAALALASTAAGRPMVAMLAVSVPVLAYELAQGLSLDPFVWNPGLKSSYWVFSTLGNPAHLGAFLAGAFWLSFAVMPRGGFAAWILRVALAVGVVMTQGRSAVLALAAGGAVWVAMWRGNSVAAGMAATAPLFTLTVSGGFDRMVGLTRLIGARMEIWKGAGRLLRESPVAGRGLDGLHSLFPAAASYAYFVAEPPSVSGTMVSLRLPGSAHNLFVDTAFGTGVVGLGLLLWALTVAFRAGRRSPYLPALVAVLVAALANPLFPPNALMFWILLAGMAGVTSRRAGSPGLVAVPAKAAPRAVPAILSGLVCAAAVGAWLDVAPVQAHAREAGRLVFLWRTGELEAQLERWSGFAAARRPRQAVSDASLYRRLWEANPRRRDLAERAEELLEEPSRRGSLSAASALADLELALGKAWRDRERLGLAEFLAREAVRLAPAVASLKTDLAAIIEARGRKAEAATLRKEARESDPGRVFGP